MIAVRGCLMVRASCWGRITGAHGIQGEVKLLSFTSDPEAIASYGPLDSSAGGTLVVRSLAPLKGMFRARLEGITDRNAAEALRA
jgi:16S rRNA processing protein RimM